MGTSTQNSLVAVDEAISPKKRKLRDAAGNDESHKELTKEARKARKRQRKLEEAAEYSSKSEAIEVNSSRILICQQQGAEVKAPN